jgi:D-amino-acid oxidase
VSNSKITCKQKHSKLGSYSSIDSCFDSFFRSPDVDLDIARDEIARAHRLAPEVVPANPPESAISHIIGIRPSRKGGFRLDSELRGSRTLLSAYGFGGGGYAFSYGVADALVKMVEQTERDHVIV